MIVPVADLSINLLATGLGAVAAHSTQHVRANMRKQATRKRIGDFFGRAGEKILVVHSSIYDEPERAYNYPATDTRSARILAQFFEESNLREGLDFTIIPDRRVVSESMLRDNNVVALCGPARNSCYRRLASAPSSMRYELTENPNPNGRGNLLRDNLRNTRIYSSRQDVSERGVTEDSHFDYGLVASLPNLRNPSKRLVLLAGIHGSGTVAATQFVANSENLRLLQHRQQAGVICEVLHVKYLEEDPETPIDVRLA
ncbi:hypothetical protein [Streptomyces sp. N50]|uniref:hypothetical protein n=1 Tax=Streptomyces sp. N50 TaxID=3081765 RepID=UPI00296234BF|nr:hypothetical protein [Streptomyces sp. N50]WOX12156.1 hypothetical protein R2B38_26470 [Streptomyces sp. N50]